MFVHYRRGSLENVNTCTAGSPTVHYRIDRLYVLNIIFFSLDYLGIIYKSR